MSTIRRLQASWQGRKEQSTIRRAYLAVTEEYERAWSDYVDAGADNPNWGRVGRPQVHTPAQAEAYARFKGLQADQLRLERAVNDLPQGAKENK